MAIDQKSPIPRPRSSLGKASPWQWVAAAAQRVANEAARGPCSDGGLRVLQSAIRTARRASAPPPVPAAQASPASETLPTTLSSGFPVPERIQGATLCGKQLTARETQVLFGLAAGKSNDVIGRELHLSEYTVKTHLRTLFRKIAAANRAHAVAIAFRHGVLS